MFQGTTQSGATLVIRQISDRHPRGNHAKPLIESSQLAQKRLEGRFMQPSFLWSRKYFLGDRLLDSRNCLLTASREVATKRKSMNQSKLSHRKNKKPKLPR